jgi:hypothetical protein
MADGSAAQNNCRATGSCCMMALANRSIRQMSDVQPHVLRFLEKENPSERLLTLNGHNGNNGVVTDHPKAA